MVLSQSNPNTCNTMEKKTRINRRAFTHFLLIDQMTTYN